MVGLDGLLQFTIRGNEAQRLPNCHIPHRVRSLPSNAAGHSVATVAMSAS